jgi:hypothetical protein
MPHELEVSFHEEAEEKISSYNEICNIIFNF